MTPLESTDLLELDGAVRTMKRTTCHANVDMPNWSFKMPNWSFKDNGTISRAMGGIQLQVFPSNWLLGQHSA